MYYILLFYVSYVLNGVVNSAYHAVTERIEVFAAQSANLKKKKYVQDLFDSLTLGERAYLAFAVAANNQLQTERALMNQFHCSKRTPRSRPPAVGYPDTDRFVIPESYEHECYIGFAGKADSLMDELIAQDKHGKNK